MTIEKRAKAYADNHLGGYQAYIDCYTTAATEQRQIDINRAVLAHCRRCPLYTDDNCPLDKCKEPEEIRKEMEV